jgi:hypothetical protein
VGYTGFFLKSSLNDWFAKAIQTVRRIFPARQARCRDQEPSF